ncbi:MAG: hypothetical protein GX986_00670 [Firmicutes bacterium]|nr:hypothetical protein [Bacillota bacterium]
MIPNLDYDTIHEHLHNMQESLTVLEQMRDIPFAELIEDTIKSWAEEGPRTVYTRRTFYPVVTFWLLLGYHCLTTIAR